MSKTGRTNYRRGDEGRSKPERHITVRSIRRDPPDLQKLSRAVIAIALREAELGADAAASDTSVTGDIDRSTAPATQEGSDV